MASFRLRHSRLRGSDSDRLRGMTVGAAGTIYPGRATAGIVFQPHSVTTMVPDPRPRVGVIMAGAGVTPTVRAGILKRDPVRASMGQVRVSRTALEPTTGRRVATGHVAVPRTAVAPAAQTREEVTGETPKMGTPTATAAPKVPGTTTGTPKVLKNVRGENAR